MTNVIGKFDDKHAFLSNFHFGNIALDLFGEGPLTFWTAEHAFQACKALAMPLGHHHKFLYLNGIVKAETPGEAKKYGRSVKIDLDKWESMKVDCMRKVLYQKFFPTVMSDQLLSTGHALLVEGNTWGDTFWGRCEGKGSNVLGSLLMELRGYYHWTAALA